MGGGVKSKSREIENQLKARQSEQSGLEVSTGGGAGRGGHWARSSTRGNGRG